MKPYSLILIRVSEDAGRCVALAISVVLTYGDRPGREYRVIVCFIVRAHTVRGRASANETWCSLPPLLFFVHDCNPHVEIWGTHGHRRMSAYLGAVIARKIACRIKEYGITSVGLRDTIPVSRDCEIEIQATGCPQTKIG